MLTQEQREYYDDLDTMFATAGWKRVIEDAKAQIYQNQADALDVPDWDAVNVLRGKSLSLVDVLNLEAVSITQRAQLEEPDYNADV